VPRLWTRLDPGITRIGISRVQFPSRALMSETTHVRVYQDDKERIDSLMDSKGVNQMTVIRDALNALEVLDE